MKLRSAGLFFAVMFLAAFTAEFAAAPARAEAIDLQYSAITLHQKDFSVTRAGKLIWRGWLKIWSQDPRFGGLSSILVRRDGNGMVSLTDKGYWITARLRYDTGGELVGIGNGAIGSLIDPKGRRIARTSRGDAESLARLGAALVVGLEGRRHRLWLYPPGAHPFARPPRRLATPSALRLARINGGIEAMTELPRGRLLIVAEKYPKPPADFHAWLFDGRKGQPRSYTRHGLFHPVGAAALPSGDVVVLERRFTWIGGVASRIVRLTMAQIESGGVLKGVEIAALAPPQVMENFEGIDTRPGPDGAALIYLIADDNFNAAQSTLLLMFSLPR